MHNGLKALRWVFIGSFIYAIFAMTISRELIIPKFFPSSVNGHIQGDPYYYHSLALDKLDSIKALGIGEFELRPKGQGPAGIASLAYLAFESPYSVVLINAILHGVSAVLMTLIILQWFSFRSTVIAILPLVISPHMIVWFSQVNKDGFTMAGGLLFVYGLIRIIGSDEKVLLRSGWIWFTSMLIGMGFMWVMRPYVNQILMPITVAILICATIFRIKKHYSTARGLVVFIIFGIATITSLGLLSRGAASDQTLDEFDRYVSVNKWDSNAVYVRCLNKIDKTSWHDESFLPNYVNKKLKAMMGQRCLIFTILEDVNANPTTLHSIVDTEQLPSGSLDALYYFPRAVLLGVFSPWPNDWGFVSKYGPSFFYTIAPLEAFLLYAGLVGLCFWILRCRQWTILVPIGMSLGVMSVYAMATPYLGALYRYRYAWWMLVICLGVGASAELLWRNSGEIRK